MSPRLLVIALVHTFAAAGAAASPAPEPHHPQGALGLCVAGGRTSVEDSGQGGFGRLEYLAFLGHPGPGDSGLIFGFTYGLQYWQKPGDWGLGLPVTFPVGYRLGPVSAIGYWGAAVLPLEDVADDVGLGLFAPLAGASLGVDAGRFRISVDARAEYHWLWGAEDRRHEQIGLVIESFVDWLGEH